MYQAGQLKQYNERCFYHLGTGTGTAIDWTSWTIPKEARFVSFYLIGPGGGGASGAVGGTVAGGGSGSSGGISSGIFQARSLPSTIFINMGAGGLGGAASTGSSNAGNGGASSGSITGTIVGIYSAPTNTNAGSTILTVRGGNGANGSTGGTAPAALTNITSGNYCFRALGLNFGGGTAGQTGGNTGSTVITMALPNNQGNAGAGVNSSNPSSAGGCKSTDTVIYGGFSTTNQPQAILVQGGTAGGVVNGGNGWDTLLRVMPFSGSESPWYSLGGAGGASDASVGGSGGYGGIGSGGGGGGSANTSGTSGAGGNGGPGFCLIEWW